MRYLGIDWGAKRIGLAYGDELGLATPLPALVQREEVARWDALAQVVAARRIQHLVVGYPLNMDDTVGFKAREVDAFIGQLAERFALPVTRQDERLTTYAAEEGLRAAKKRDKRDRKVRASGEVDSRAAVLILQDYLDVQMVPSEPLDLIEENHE